MGASALSLIAACVVAVLSIPAGAQPSAWRLDPIGGWGGGVNHIQVEGDIAYLGVGQRLVILDLSDESDPIERGSVGLGSAVQDFVVRGSYAYVATASSPNYFCIVDVTDDTRPVLIWNADGVLDGVRRPREVDLFGNIAYVRTVGTLKAFDISDPFGPVNLGEVALEFGPPGVLESQIVGSNLFLGGEFNGNATFYVYDLTSNPVALSRIAAITVPIDGPADLVSVEGDRAYVASHIQNDNFSSGAVAVVDIADPTRPRVLGSWECSNPCANDAERNPFDISPADGMVYVAHGAAGTAVIDFATDPSNPALVTWMEPDGLARGVHVSGNRAYLLDFGKGLLIQDVTDPGNPAPIGRYHSPGLLHGIAREGDLLFVSDAYTGFTILDVSEPGTPRVVGVYETPDSAGSLEHPNLKIAVLDGKAYLSAGTAGVEIVDVTDPTDPVLEGAFRLDADFANTFTQGLAMSTDLRPGHLIAHVGLAPLPGGSPWLVNLDVTDPASIVVDGSLSLPKSPVAIALGRSQVGDEHPVAYLARDGAANGTFMTVNIDALTIDYDGPGPSPTSDVAARDGIIYTAKWSADQANGLHVLDAADPSNPVLLFRRTGRCNAVALDHPLVYATKGEHLDVFDMTDPNAPVLLLGREGVTAFTSLHIDGPWLYAAVAEDLRPTRPTGTGGAGLVVFVSSCSGDLTGSSNAKNPAYGVPNGVVDADDFFYYLDQFVADNFDVADLTGSSNPNDPAYGVPNGVIDGDDFFFYLDLFVLGCP